MDGLNDKEVQQPNVMNEEPPNQLAIAADPNIENDETRPQIFKLDVDCVQEMFDWLSIEDISSVAETCTRMKKIAGDYYQSNLTALCGRVEKCYHLNGLTEFFQYCRIGPRYGYRYRDSVKKLKHCKSLKKLEFSGLNVNELYADIFIYTIKPLLSKIEAIAFNRETVQGEFYMSYLQFCPSLQHLSVLSMVNYFNNDAIIGTNNEWLLRSYPALEHLEMHLYGMDNIPELGEFFKQNPNLQTLLVSENVFLANIHAMLNAKIKLQVLIVTIYKGDEETIFRYLSQLHDQGFYQRLHPRMFYTFDQQRIDKVCSLNVEKLYFSYSMESAKVNLDSLTNLKELYLTSYEKEFDPFPIDSESTAKSLVNLERIYIYFTSGKMIEPFIRHSKKLKAIKIFWLKRKKIIDVCSLNKERELLLGARKVTIYLSHKNYLATKWRSKTIDTKMIEVKRAESYEWQIPYNFEHPIFGIH